LGGEERGLFADCFTEDGFDVFVAALVGFPVRVAEGFGNRVDVEFLDEGLVGVCFGGGGCHFDGILLWICCVSVDSMMKREESWMMKLRGAGLELVERRSKQSSREQPIRCRFSAFEFQVLSLCERACHRDLIKNSKQLSQNGN